MLLHHHYTDNLRIITLLLDGDILKMMLVID